MLPASHAYIIFDSRTNVQINTTFQSSTELHYICYFIELHNIVEVLEAMWAGRAHNELIHPGRSLASPKKVMKKKEFVQIVRNFVLVYGSITKLIFKISLIVLKNIKLIVNLV